MKVEQVMTRDVVTVTPETPLKEAALILAERRISGLPVCDETSRVVGVVSENDILFKELGPDQRRGGPLAWLLDPAPSRSPKTIARTTAEAMTSPAVTTRPKAQVSEAARVMVERGVNRLPVVKEGRLVGIVTRADLVNAFVRSDEEITHEIREDVIRKTLWLVPEELTVEVERPTSVDEVNELFGSHADTGELTGILGYSDEPLVSSDAIKSPYSAVFDSGLTLVTGETQVKVVAWYDNEWGYSTRLAELAQLVLAPVPQLV